MGAYLVPTSASIYWLFIDHDNFFLLSFSCLLLDFKFLMFFKAFESFGVYFVIIVGVARRIASFLVVLFFILVSFAHAFFVLLKPSFKYPLNEPMINDDPNNPWNLTNSYKTILENGTIASNISLIQEPSSNINMFTDATTALFAMYLYLTGMIYSFIHFFWIYYI